MFKLTVLYNHPTDPAAFEKYYREVHIPMAAKVPHVLRCELTKFEPGPDGSKPAFYRTAEFHFATAEHRLTALTSPEGQAAAADLAHFADGGAHFLLGQAQIFGKSASA
jgi:uncharacterized protein (TIGR02118 family)